MLKTIHLSSKILTLLLVVLLITIGPKPPVFAGESPFLFRKTDFLDIGSLAVKLQGTRTSFSKFLASQLSAKTQQVLTEYDGASIPSPTLQKGLLADFNKLLQVSLLHNKQHFAGIPLSKQTQKLLAENPKSGEALIRLNRFLLADAYPCELASPSDKQIVENAKGIETCRENLRQIKRALENYRIDANAMPQQLSELSPQLLDPKALLCPADAIGGKRGVLTEGAAAPMLPCSYLYEYRSAAEMNQESSVTPEDDRPPIVRCQHHLLNLSISGKLYRNGPQRAISKNNSSTKVIEIPSSQKTYHIRSQEDLESLREVLGDDFFKTPEGKELLEKLPSTAKQPETENRPDTSQSITRIPSSQKTYHIRSQEDLEALRELLGDDFFKTPEGKELLEKLPSTAKNTEMQKQIGKPIPDVPFKNSSGASVTLDTFRDKFVLIPLFFVDSVSCGPDLQRLQKQLEKIDTSQLQVIGISAGGTLEAIAAFQEKYQISMPLWVDEKSEILRFLSNDTGQPQTKLITILLEPKLVVHGVFMDMKPLLQKVMELTKLKE